MTRDTGDSGLHLDESVGVKLLDLLATAAGRPFDPTRAADAVRTALREIPPTEGRAARLRLVQSAASIGVQVVVRQLSVADAVKFVQRGGALAVFAITHSGSARWFVLEESTGSRARLAALYPDDPADRWVSAKELKNLIGAEGPKSVLEWQLPQPAAPLGEPAAHPLRAAHGHDNQDHHGGPSPFRRLAGLLQPEAGEIWVIVLFAVGIGFLYLATPIVTMAVVNTVALGTIVQQLLVLCVALFVALGLAALLQGLQTVVVEYLQRRVFVRVAADLAYRLPRVELAAFDRQHGPELVNRFFDVLTVQKAGAVLLIDGVTLALQMLIGLLLLGYYHVYLLGFDLVLLTALTILVFGLGRGAIKTSIRESIAKYAVAGWMEEVARHPIAFKFAGGQRLAQERTDALSREYLLARSSHFRVLMRQFGFALFLQAAANVALLAIGGFLVMDGRLTLGELVAAQIVVTLVVAAFAKLGKQLEAWYDLLAAVDKLGYLIDLPLERAEGHYHPRGEAAATVRFCDVAFSYGEGLRQVFSKLAFRMEPGQRVALVGPEGSGKTTLVDLLFGLRTPTQGWIEIDGVDLRQLRLDSLREQVAVVKGLEIFEDSVYENVRMGREWATHADVRGALEKVGLLQTILDLPDGLSATLGAGGAPLSLGEATRLLIARAVLSRPRLLILDETLDSMDAETRTIVLETLLEPDAPWTLLVSTHSDEIASLMGRVFHLENGDVVEVAPSARNEAVEGGR